MAQIEQKQEQKEQKIDPTSSTSLPTTTITTTSENSTTATTAPAAATTTDVKEDAGAKELIVKIKKDQLEKDTQEWLDELSATAKTMAGRKRKSSESLKPHVDNVSINMTASQILALCKGQGKEIFHTPLENEFVRVSC